MSNDSIAVDDLNWEQNSDFIQAKDYYGNTALHYAAAAQNFEVVLKDIDLGVPVEAVNTSGETFLHLLDASRDMERYIEILRRTVRQSPSFQFRRRDHCGSSIP